MKSNQHFGSRGSFIATLITVLSLFAGLTPVNGSDNSARPSYSFPPLLEGSRWPEVNFSHFPPSELYESGSGGAASLQLPICSSEIAKDCIESLVLIQPDGTEIAGIFDGYIPVTWTGQCTMLPSGELIPKECGIHIPTDRVIDYEENLARNHTAGSRDSLWTFPSISTEFQFLLSVGLRGRLIEKGGTSFSAKDSGDKISWSSFVTNLIPVVISAGTEGRMAPLPPSIGWANEGVQCFSQGSQLPLCASFAPYSGKDDFKLSIRLDSILDFLPANQWMSARAENAAIESEPIAGSQGRRLVLSGGFTRVHAGIFDFESDEATFQKYDCIVSNQYVASRQNFSQEYDSTLEKCLSTENGEIDELMYSQFKRGDKISTEGDQSISVYLWSGFSALADPRILRTNSVWRFRTLEYSRQGSFSASNRKLIGCLDEFGSKNRKFDIAGISFSDASIFSPDPPSWNESDQSLNFKLAGVHKDLDGELVRGFYGLRIRDSFAKCLWPVNPSNSKAELSVINSDGKTQVVTSSSSLRSDFWNFSIDGLHFSVPKIKIQVKDLSSPPAAKQPKSQKVIRCVKGKKTVKTSATRCPSGYKRV